MDNQASSLREYVDNNNLEFIKKENKKYESKKSRIIAIASGKGGVGKSTITVNLALALKKLNQEVFIIDSDIGMANIDVLLGLQSKFDLNHVFKGTCTLKDAIETGPYGLSILSGISGIDDILDVSNNNIQNLLLGLDKIERDYDVILLDTGAGASHTVINFLSSADEVLIVLTPEPTSIMDSYSLIKILNSKNYSGNIQLLVNRVESKRETDKLVNRFLNTSNKYLDLDINLLGYIREDNRVTKSVKKQHPFFMLYPETKLTENILKLAGDLIGKDLDLPSRGIKSFFYKFIGQIVPGR